MEQSSIIDGTNCSPKAVLACRSVNLVFISFSVQQRKGTVIDFLKQSSGLSASTLSLIICLSHILSFLTSVSSGSHILALLSKHWWLNCSTFALLSSEFYLNLRFLKLCLCQVISLVVILQRTFVSWNNLCPIQMLYS